MAQQLTEIAVVVNDPAPPTFANTLVAMERSGRLLARAQGAFSVEVATNSNPQLLRIRQTLAPELAAHADAIYLNRRLFTRVAVIYKQLPSLKLDPESRHLVITYYRRFLHAGANLPPAKQAQLKQLNQQLATLQATFERKLLAGTAAAALLAKSKSDLEGLSDSALAASQRAAAAKDDPTGYLIALQNTTQQPALASLTDRATRRSCSTIPGRAPRRATRTTRAPRSRSSPISAPRRRSCSAIRIMPPTCSTTRWPRRRTRC